MKLDFYFLKIGIVRKSLLHLSLLVFLTFINVNLMAQQVDSNEVLTNNNTRGLFSDRKQNLFVQLKFDYGGLLPVVREEGINSYYGLDLRLAWQKRVNNLYSAIYRAPKFGFGFYSASFDNNAFGEPNGLYGFMDIPLHFPRSKWNFVYSLGIGLAFNFNYYDPIDNPGNELLGSKRNVYFSLSFEGKYNITEHWVTGLGVGFKHFSNGRLFLPNSGVNLLPFTFIAEYNFGDSETDLAKPKLTDFIPFNMVNVYGAVGNKNFEYGKAVYFKSTLGVNILRQFSYKFRYGLGMELFYTAGSLDRVVKDKSNFNKQFSYGVAGLFEWLVTEHLYLIANLGLHINSNIENFEKPFFQRIGIRYALGNQKKLFVGTSLKVTEFHADYVEWNIGYSFKKDPNKYKLLY